MRPVLFDLDGTLVDSAPDLAASLAVALAGDGLPPISVAGVRRIIGEGATKLVERAWATLGAPLPPDALPERVERFLDHYLANVVNATVLYPEVIPTLERLRAAGHPLAVCTNKPEQPSHAILEALGVARFFPVVIGGDTLGVRKPDPAPLRAAIERLGAGNDAVMVGDSAFDVAAARAAGLRVIGASWGYARGPLDLAGADATVDRFADLPDALAAMAL